MADSVQHPRLAAFEPLLGEWLTTGTHPYLPGRRLRGRVSFERIENGAFVRMRSTSSEPEIPSGVAIFGTDDAARAGTMLYFDERGVSRLYAFEIAEGELRWWRDDPAFGQRFTVRVGGDRLSGKGEMSKNGAPWEGDLDLEYERA